MLFTFIKWSLRTVTFLSCFSVVTSSQADISLEFRESPSLPLKVHTLWQFEKPSWCENLVVRANGQLLVTRLDTPELYQIDPTNKTKPILIASWNASFYHGASGISETTPDVFAVNLAAPYNKTFVKTSGIPAVYKVDMNTFKADCDGVVEKNATVSMVTELPTADFPNGMVTLDESHVFIADPYNGWVYKVDVVNGTHSIAINDPKMKFPVGSPTNLGVNGLKIRDSYLYWTNTAVGSLNKIQITDEGKPIGTSSVVVDVARPDDFIIKDDGTYFFMENQLERLSVFSSGMSQPEVVAGSNTSTILAGVTAGKFGKLDSDRNRLYLTTSGGLAKPVNGTIVVGAKVAYVDTEGY